MKDYYNILEIDNDSNDAEIKNAFFRLSKTFHPSVSKTDKTIPKFIELYEAFYVLECDNVKVKYDEFYRKIFIENEENLIDKKVLKKFFDNWELESKKEGLALCKLSYKRFERKINGAPWYFHILDLLFDLIFIK